MKNALTLLLFFLTTSLGFAQADSTRYNPTGLRYDVLQYPWSINLDAMRFIHQIPSIQLSLSYRLKYRFEVESELTYYLTPTISSESDRLDELSVNLKSGAPNFNLSGIGKIFFGDSKISYVGFKLAGGMNQFDISRNVCTESAPTNNDAICRCLNSEYRSDVVKISQFTYGFRFGVTFPISKRLRMDTFLDYSFYKNSKPNLSKFEHNCSSSTWDYRDNLPNTDGLFDDFQRNPVQSFFSYALKFGYAF